MSLVTAAFAANPHTLPVNIECARAELAGAGPATVIAWALARADNPVITTNFRPGSAALLHMVTRARADIPVVWVDTGYNTPATYRYVEALAERWQLNLYCYTPRVTVARQVALGGVPAPDHPRFARFVRHAKIEPFERAFNEIGPDLWFTGVRAEQSDFREGLGVVSRGPRNTLRVAPLIDWTAAQVADYLAARGIADNHDYVDPTKPGARLECGLQLLG